MHENTELILFAFWQEFRGGGYKLYF